MHKVGDTFGRSSKKLHNQLASIWPVKISQLKINLPFASKGGLRGKFKSVQLIRNSRKVENQITILRANFTQHIVPHFSEPFGTSTSNMVFEPKNLLHPSALLQKSVQGNSEIMKH